MHRIVNVAVFTPIITCQRHIYHNRFVLRRKVSDVTYCVHDFYVFETSFAVAGLHGQNLNVIFKPVFFDFLRDDARNVRAVPDKLAVIASVVDVISAVFMSDRVIPKSFVAQYAVEQLVRSVNPSVDHRNKDGIIFEIGFFRQGKPVFNLIYRLKSTVEIIIIFAVKPLI